MSREIRTVSLGEVERRPRKVAIGTFDGVHLGHRNVIDGFETVLTFEPHPLEVLKPEAAPDLLMPFELKRDTLADIGVEEVVVIPFDREFTRTTAKEFIDEILVDRLDAQAVSVGENFRFGSGASGDPETLEASGQFETRVVPLVELDGETVSSTRIRSLISRGDVAEAMRCLGSPFQVEGVVVHGDGRGRELGYPTANIVPDPGLVTPGHGVYAAFADGRPAAVNVGVRPTFQSERGLLIEAHLIDVDEDLYGKPLRVSFLDLLREEEAFPEVEELINQMGADVEAAREVCASFQRPGAGT